MTTTRAQHARYNASPKGLARYRKFRTTAKGMVNDVNQEAKRRGNG